METGFRATFVISWAQTETDGLKRASRDQIVMGTSWRWSGAALRIDVPDGPLVLGSTDTAADMRRHASVAVQRLVRAAVNPGTPVQWPVRASEPAGDEPQVEGFVVTDGLRTYPLMLIDAAMTGARLVMAMDEMPPVDQDLWVIKTALEHTPRPRILAAQSGVICFGPGTRLATPDGSRAIEDLGPGDRILTKDNGPQDILWTANRRMSGARLHAMPHLRPVRFRAGALGAGQPDQDLVVSPQHRMLVRAPVVQDLFRTDEVLVQASHLLNGTSITVDRALRDVTYVHVLLERHNVIWANGLETESFHPAHMDLGSLQPAQHDTLMALLPDLAGSAQSYGTEVRRLVTSSEAAMLRHGVAA